MKNFHSKCPAMDDMKTKHQHSFIFLEANQHEHHEEQPLSNFWRTDNDMHDDLKKDDKSETGRYCVELIF